MNLWQSQKKKKILTKCLDISFEIIDKSDSTNKHASFLIDKNRIVSIGVNDFRKTHPLVRKHGYYYQLIHSELNAIIRFDGKISDLSNCVLVNTRVNRLGQICMSKPCKNCCKMLNAFDIHQVIFTNQNGEWEDFKNG